MPPPALTELDIDGEAAEGTFDGCSRRRVVSLDGLRAVALDAVSKSPALVLKLLALG